MRKKVACACEERPEGYKGGHGKTLEKWNREGWADCWLFETDYIFGKLDDELGELVELFIECEEGERTMMGS